MPEPQQTPVTTQTSSTNNAGESSVGNQTNTGRGRGNIRSNNGRGGRGGRSNYRERRSNNLQSIINTDRDFEGKVATIGVIGLPSERNLKHGLQLDDFNDSVMNHIGTNWDKGNYLKCLVMHLERPEKYIEEPSDIAPNKDTEPGKYEKWKIEVVRSGKLMDIVTDNQVKLYNLVLGQCSPSLEIEIRGDKKFKKKDRNSDALWLLKTIKKIMSGVTLRKNETLVYCNMVRELLTMTQGPTETMEAFIKRLLAKMQTVELAGGVNFFFPDLKNIQVSDSENESSSEYSEESDSESDSLDSDNEIIAKKARNARRAELRAKAKADRDTRKAARILTKDQRKIAKIKKMKQDMVKSMILMQQADRMRYGARYDELDRATDLGRDEFPRTFNQAVDVLSMAENRLIEQHTRSQNRFSTGTGSNSGRGTGGATFAQVTGGSGRSSSAGRGNFERRAPTRNEGGQFCIPTGEQVVPGNDGTIVAMQCYTCGRYGHTNQNNNCPTGTGD